MTFARVLGQPRAVDRLRGALARQTLHHAYLFAGPEGVGKELCARAFAQALLCPKAPGEGCGECETCTRIDKGTHPDVQWVIPEAERVRRGLSARADFDHVPSREIRVDQIRALGERLALRPLEASRKVAVILFAGERSEAPQNALLKTLEEPPPDTVLILSSPSADRLLPTLRSRCSRVPFGPLPASLVADRLQADKGVDRPTAELAAELSGGSLARALELDVDALASRRELIARFEALEPADARTLLAFAEAHGRSRDDAEAALELLSVWLRDVLRVAAGVESIAQVDLLPLARQTAARRSEIELLRRHRLVGLARTAIARNGSPRLQLERMLIGMVEAGR